MICMTGYHVAVDAQVYIQSALPATGMIQKNQLWNMIIVNSTSSSLEGKLELVLVDRITSREVMTATTGRFTVSKGSVLLNVNQLNPIQYNYLGLQPSGSLNGFLPVGSYSACYSFVNTTPGKQETIAEECVAFDTEPLSPPVLNFPSDSSVLEQMPSQFSWIPPAPAGMINQLRYEILITEIKTGQKPAEALSENMPFYSNGSLPSNFLVYSAASPAFEKEKWYAWQVVARDNRSYAGKSEVWVFKVTETLKAKKTSQSVSYIVLKDEQEKAQYEVEGKSLYVKYHSYLPEQQAIFEIFNNEGILVQSIKQKVVYGDNFLQFELNRAISSGNLYTIKVTGQNNRVFSASFLIN